MRPLFRSGGAQRRKYVHFNAAKSSALSPVYFVSKTGSIPSASSIGFWFVHQAYSGSSYGNYAVSVNEIESRTGLNLFANLPDSIEETVENNDSWQSFQNFR